MKEEWYEIENFSNYLLSNTGKIKAKEKVRWNGRCYATFKEKELSFKVKEGHIYGRQILISDSEITENVSIDNLIIKQFYTKDLPYSIEFYQLKHKDKDYTNLNFDNLELEINDFAIRVYDYEGNFLKDYPNKNAFCDELNVEYPLYNGIYTVCKGGQLECNNFQFRFLNCNPKLKLATLTNVCRPDVVPIAKYFDNRLISVYNSITEAFEKTNISIIEIWESLDRNKIINGFLFKRL